MANIENYIEKYGNLTLNEEPFNNVDNLILSNLSYLVFRGAVPEIDYRKKSLISKLSSIIGLSNKINTITIKDAVYKMNFNINEKENIRVKQDIDMTKKLADSKRFGNMLLTCYIDEYDENIEIQFSAITILMEDNTAYVAYRGTDTTLIGWKEDFNMSFMEKIPAQAEALKYLLQVASIIKQPLRIGGHSKGGNLAVYASMYAGSKIQNRIINIYNNDGPGFQSKVLEKDEYKAIKNKLTTIIPQTSIVGMLLEHEEHYIVVKSNETLIMQHDPYTWEVDGCKFVIMENTTDSSKIIDKTLSQWLNTMSMEQREKFVDILWDILGATKVKTFPELVDKFVENTMKIKKAYSNLDPQSKEILSNTFSALFKSAKDVIAKNYFK